MAFRLSQNFQTFTRLWYLVDAKDQVVGRLAAMLSLVLQGKTKPIYHPAVDVGDNVVVINTRHVMFTGKKWKQKVYRHHTGYPGLKVITAENLHCKDPTLVMQKAVNGMLPRNNLRKKRLRRLHLFADEEHPYGANISYILKGPCPVLKKLGDYTADEISSYPVLFDLPGLSVDKADST
ncbi:large ribosomal subunit protein uL13-like [Corticium candelabrum]|uniref:large ribosomal subunit protein uL13-like n=1 Tax=Corticium candelabrum TaxID=121492 RepID=UPI002E259F69|nr:large ribosomal subunit protein uL13-like [Corticium candelabrum]